MEGLPFDDEDVEVNQNVDIDVLLQGMGATQGNIKQIMNVERRAHEGGSR